MACVFLVLYYLRQTAEELALTLKDDASSNRKTESEPSCDQDFLLDILPTRTVLFI